MPITFVDIVFLFVVIVSAIMAYGSGFVSEAFGLASWIGAAAVAKLGYPYLEPIFTETFGITGALVKISSYVTVFVISVLLFSFFRRWVSNTMEGSMLSEADKSLGVLFGAVRGVVVVAILFIGMLWFIPNPSDRPAWASQGRSQPLIRVTALLIVKLLPSEGSFAHIVDIVGAAVGKNEGETFEKLLRPDAQAPAAAEVGEFGYKPSETRELDREIQQINLGQ